MAHSLVIGASGQVGHAIYSALSARNMGVTGTYGSQSIPGLARLDIVDAEAVRTFVHQLRPDVIYLPASLCNVDYCEQSPEAVYPVNVSGVLNVIEAANSVGALIVYLSSDYVFDGVAGPYCEADPPNPICEYGKQKLIAEHALGWLANRALVARTTVVFGPERLKKNFIYRLADTLGKGSELRVPSDQIGSPTYGPDLAGRLIDLALAGATGVFHVAGPQVIGRYDFAVAAARILGLPAELIRPVTTEELGQRARRPLRAGLRIDKLISATGKPTMSFEDGLRAMRGHLS